MDQLEVGIEDIAGIRIMCQFVEDIEKVAEMIRARKDMEMVYVKDYIKNKKESGYRSYHLIVKYPVQTSLGQTEILAEIQIRTLAMNFWATIEHSLNYKYKQSLPDDLRARLKKAAEAAFQLDEEMSSIRDEIIHSQRMFEDKSSLVSKLLNDIQQLYFYRRVRDAAAFQLRFNELWEKEDMWGLKMLANQIESAMADAKGNVFRKESQK